MVVVGSADALQVSRLTLDTPAREGDERGRAEVQGGRGVGKTHIAVALGMEAVANGHNVYLITVPELLDELARDVERTVSVSD
jgi:chromosomal replication initiation ATPase DnaA